LEDVGVDGRRWILKLIVKKYVVGRMWLTSQGVCLEEFVSLTCLIVYLTQVVGTCLLFCMGVKLMSLTLREEHRLRVFETRGLRRIFGPKRDEVTGEWSRLHNEELNDLYSSSDIIRVIK
jgi:hypothetical protein